MMYEAMDNADTRRMAVVARLVFVRRSQSSRGRSHKRGVASLSDRRMKLARALSGLLH
jgi:hypothetical protein